MHRTIRRIALWGGLTVGLGLIIWGLYAASRPAGIDANAVVPAMSDTDHISGNRTAAAVLIEYADFQCPACAQYQSILNQLKDTYGDRLAVVYRHYPLPQHQYAQLAAQAAEAADKQGQFWPMHDLLFDRQTSWSQSLNAKPIFIDYAKQLGLNVEQFTADLESQSIKDRIKTDVNSGNAARLPGTPSFFFNGKAVTNPTGLNSFTTLIDNALQS